MPNRETARRLSSLALFVLPLLAVKLAALAMGGSTTGSAKASLSPVNAPAPATASGMATTTIEWSVAQQAAAQHVRHLAAAPFGPPPMLHIARATNDAPQPMAPRIESPRENPMPAFALQAVMEAASGDKALINGRPYVAGQFVHDTEWLVREINVGNRTAVLATIDGSRVVTITVQIPD